MENRQVTPILQAPKGNNQLTMSSREIAELVNSRHDDVKRSVERLAERGIIQLPPLADVKNHKGQTVKEYRIGKRDSYVIVAQLSPEFTARLVDRWQELEAKTKEPDRAGCVMERDSIMHGHQVMASDISLRDYFAAAALQGLLACIGTGLEASNPLTYFPKRSYQYADAMLAVKNQREQ